jgi:AAA family ATP:ADP antiporter
MMSYSPAALIITVVASRSINYAFAQPIRESLYIPTIKDMKFKSKAWIDAFGFKLAKSAGATFCMASEFVGSAFFMPMHAAYFGLIVVLWSITAFLLGDRFNKAIRNNEVIGVEPEPQQV